MLKVFGITKRLNRRGHRGALALALILSAFSFFSCVNDVGIDDFCNTESSDCSEKIVFSGHLDHEGAVPKAVTNVTGSQPLGRAALPSFALSSGFQYFISATCKSPAGINEVIEGTVDQEAKTYTIGLTLGRTYTLTASLKKVDATGNPTETLMEAEWPNVKPSRENTNFNHDFMLKPAASGSGTIALEITVPSGIKAEISGDEWNNLSPKPLVSTSGTKVTISGSDIPVGNYLVSINFYKVDSSGSQFLQYSIPQTINVCAKMTTDTWQSGGSSSSPISGNTFVLTDEIIKNYQRTIFYVSEKDFTGKAIENGQARTGSPYAPFATLSDALNTIANNNKAEDYRIFIGGSVKGSTTISVAKTKAKSITIEGFTGNSKDILDGNGVGRVLQVSTEVPLTIKNLKITGGHAEGSGVPGKGGGIFVAFKANVILDSGALVGDETETLASSESYGNRAEVSGGGIYVDAGTLILKNGSKVCRNYAGSNDSDKDSGGGGIASIFGKITIEEGAYVSYNKTCGRGGGIWLIGGNSASILAMNGGEISHNETEYWGGGLLVGSVDGHQGESCPVKFYFKGGEICNNKSNSEDYGWGPGGGGLIVDHSYMEMSGSAKIHDNESKNAGGGLRIGSNSVFLMSGGEIYDNTCSREFDSDGVTPISGGGLDIEPNSKVVISGSAKIPYGFKGDKGYRKNDIWLRYADNGETPSYITVGGALSSTFEMGIELDCQRGLCIVRADGTNVTDLTPYKDYFKLIKDDWLLKLSPDNKKLVLDSPFYVAGQSIHPTCGKAGSASGDGSLENPLDTIQNAVNVIKNLPDAASTDYTILIDGELKPTNALHQSINSDVQIHSLTIKGANGLDTNGEPKDVINGQADATQRVRGITFDTDKVPVTIECLKITNGLADQGGGIYLSVGAKLTLGDDVLVTGNAANNSGGGIYIVDVNSKLKVKGNAKVIGNTISGTETPSNVYLQNGQKINVVGSLVNSTKKAEIGVSVSETATLPFTITSDYGYAAGGYNAGVNPTTYFHGDKWGVKLGTGTSPEALLAASGGQLIIEPIYEDITVKVDKSSVLKSAAEKKFTFSAIGTDSEGNTSPITIGSGEGQLALTIESVTYHGETVPASYYGTGTNYVTFGSSMPAGNYTINTRAVYQGSLSEARTYSAGFEVKIVDVADVTSVVTSIKSMTASGTISVSGAIDYGDLISIVSAISEIQQPSGSSQYDPPIKVTLDLSNTVGLTEITNTFDDHWDIEQIILPEGITKINSIGRVDNCVTLNIPSTVTEISDFAFFRCKSNITLDEGNSAFKIVGDGLYTKDGKTFVTYCKKQEEHGSCTIVSGTEKIADGAFSFAEKLETITFATPSSLTEIGQEAFDYCSSLGDVVIPDTVTTLGPGAFQYAKVTSMTLSSNITEIKGETFSNNDFTEIVIPDGVTSIGSGAFWACHELETITLPASVTNIADAFGYCENLTTVNYKGSEEQRNAITIDSGSNNDKLRNANWVYNYTGD